MGKGVWWGKACDFGCPSEEPLRNDQSWTRFISGEVQYTASLASTIAVYGARFD